MPRRENIITHRGDVGGGAGAPTQGPRVPEHLVSLKHTCVQMRARGTSQPSCKSLNEVSSAN